jgi:hypothetical protein
MSNFSTIAAKYEQMAITLGYDVLVSESYDWWAVYLSLPQGPALLERLRIYECRSDGNGFNVNVASGRMILYFGMQMDYDSVYGEWGEDTFEGLADLFATVRDELLRAVRIIESEELFLIETALHCLLSPTESADWGYRVAKEHAERYEPRYGTGLIPESAPMVREIAEFWCRYHFRQSLDDWLVSSALQDTSEIAKR